MPKTIRHAIAAALCTLPLLVTSAPSRAFANGYTVDPWTAADVVPFGQAPNFGSTGNYGQIDFSPWPTAPIVGMATTPDGQGYWEVASDGGVFAFHQFPNLSFFGSMGGTHLNQPMVGMASSATGNGYWEVAADGGIFTFGDATYFGSTGGMRLNRPIVGMARTPTGLGYWLVASDGGIFTFGDAKFYGSTGSIRLNQPIVGMAPTPTGHGYSLVAADGGIFTFGDAGFFGSTGGLVLNSPIVGMAATPTGDGYWLSSADGGIFTFGDATFFGSYANRHTDQQVVGIAATPTGDGYWLVGAGFCYPPLTSIAPVTATGASAPSVAILSTATVNIPGCREQATHTYRSQNLFSYNTPSAEPLSFDVRYVSTPTPGPSGQPIHLAGNAFLEITIRGTTSADLPVSQLVLPGSPVVAAQQTEDFEGTSRFVLGLSQKVAFWAGEILDPIVPSSSNLVVEFG